MRYVIYGAGAIGGTIGARLQMAGHPVTFVARGSHLEAMQIDGLTFATPEGIHKLAVSVAGSAAEAGIGPDDFVFLAVKSQDTIGALDDIRSAAGNEVPIACAQNGVTNERMTLRQFPRTYATVVMLPASHLKPGVVQCESAPTTGILDTGCYPLGTDETCEQVCADLETATFSARPDGAVMRQKYRKLLLNLDNAVGALCVPSDGAKELSRLCRAEADAAFKAAGVDCASDDEFWTRRGDYIQLRPVEGSERGGTSSWQSLVRGTGSIEADYLNGEIVLLGRVHGVPTPANRLLQDEAHRAANEGLKPASLDPSKLLERVATQA